MTELFKFFFGDSNDNKIMLVTLGMRILMLITSGLFIISIISYLRKYKVFEAIFSKLTGNAREYDRIRRIQMRTELEKKNNAFSKKEKSSIITKVYALISKTGIIERIPGFSEAGFLISVLILTAIYNDYYIIRKN